MKLSLFYFFFLVLLSISCKTTQQSKSSYHYVPKIGEWRQIAGVPDIGKYNNDKMESVDFAVWQAEDGTWQLVSCIRYCGNEADERVLHRWEGKNLADTFWTPKGVYMVADTSYGEQAGWIQAPYVVKKDSKYLFFYGGGGQICVAEGTNGKDFKRKIQENGKTKIFECELYGRARDIMIMQNNDIYYGYYTGSSITTWPDDTKGAVFCRTSNDLITWGEEVLVSETDEDVVQFLSSECPQVLKLDDKFYLFKTQEYKPGHQQTTLFCSENPLNFGINTDSLKVTTLPISAPEVLQYQNEYYIAALMPDLKGIRIAKLTWEKKESN